MTTDLQALIQHLRGGDWNLRAPQEMADMIADKLEAALAAAPSTTPTAVPTVEYVEGSWMAVAAPSASHAEAPADYFYTCDLLGGNPQPVAPAGQAAAGVQGEVARLLALASEEHNDAAASVQHGADQADVPEWARLVVRVLGQPSKPAAYWIPKAEQFCVAPKDGSRPFAKAWEPLYPASAVERGVTIERSVAQEIRETLSTYVTTYNDCWERGMDILEPMGDKALALLDAALSTAGKEQA